MGCQVQWLAFIGPVPTFIPTADMCSEYYMGLITHTLELQTLIFMPINNPTSPLRQVSLHNLLAQPFRPLSFGTAWCFET